MASFEDDGIDWTGRGYFGCPDPPRPKQDPVADPWGIWLTAFHRAKRGDFALVPTVMPYFKQEDDPVLLQVASYLVGDAGTPACFETVVGEFDRIDNRGIVLEYCSVLHYRGKLADVPRILGGYERIADWGDADIVPVWLSNLLEPEDGPLSEYVRPDELADYSTAVLNRYKELADELGTDQVYVFRGKRFGVVPLAKYMLRRIQKPFVRDELRHRFEASTGIDCSRFYRGGDLRPLAAAAILEDFLAGPDAANYEEGVRYFFGHRILD